MLFCLFVVVFRGGGGGGGGVHIDKLSQRIPYGHAHASLNYHRRVTVEIVYSIANDVYVSCRRQLVWLVVCPSLFCTWKLKGGNAVMIPKLIILQPGAYSIVFDQIIAFPLPWSGRFVHLGNYGNKERVLRCSASEWVPSFLLKCVVHAFEYSLPNISACST